MDHIHDAIEGLQSAANANEGIDEAIAAIEEVVMEADSAFSLRRDMLANLAGE